MGIVIVLLLLTGQKKRLVRRPVMYQREKKLLLLRLALLIPLFAFVLLLPELFLCLMGYGFAGIRMIGAWLPWSFVVMFGAADVLVLLMLLSAVVRFVRCRKMA